MFNLMMLSVAVVDFFFFFWYCHANWGQMENSLEGNFKYILTKAGDSLSLLTHAGEWVPLLHTQPPGCYDPERCAYFTFDFA